MKNSSGSGATTLTCSHVRVRRPIIRSPPSRSVDRPQASGYRNLLCLPKNFPRHIRDTSCMTTSNRILSKNVFSNHRRISAARRGSKVWLNIDECIANPSASRRSSGPAKRRNWSGARRGRKFSNGSRRSRNGSSEAS